MDRISVVFGETYTVAGRNPFDDLVANIPPSLQFAPYFQWVKKDDKGVYKAVTNRVSCRDHFIDDLERAAGGRSRHSSGHFIGEIKPLDTDATRLMMTFHGTALAENFVKNFQFVQAHEFEFFKNVKPSALFEVDMEKWHKQGATDIHKFLVEADPLFMKAGCLNSVYTLLLRLAIRIKNPELPISAVTQSMTGDAHHVHHSSGQVKRSFKEYCAAMEQLDFSQAKTPSGNKDPDQFRHSTGGLLHLSNYISKFRATGFEEYPTNDRSLWQQNVFGDQLIEMLK